jgi:uncharacterized protein (UPF0276 family)
MYGVGLRHIHFPEILKRLEADASSLNVDFFEIITENFFQTKGRPFKILERVRQEKPISFHGVSLSIASEEGINKDYVKKVKELAEIIEPIRISDHLCWTGLKKNNLHNLLPLPYSHEMLEKISQRVIEVQTILGRELMLENLSAYMSFKENDFTEAGFLAELTKKTGCKILLDMNNVYVNSHNQKFNPHDFLNEIPNDSVGEIHLAGFTDMGKYYFDTHSCPVWQPVWDLYKEHKQKYKNAIITVEWDEDIPSYDVVLAEVEKARLYGI